MCFYLILSYFGLSHGFYPNLSNFGLTHVFLSYFIYFTLDKRCVILFYFILLWISSWI